MIDPNEPDPAICSLLAFRLGFVACLVLLTGLLVNQGWQSVSAPPNSSGSEIGVNAVDPTLIIDINEATAAQWALLPRVGTVLAGRIVQDREDHGAFGSIEALERVPGIGDKTLAGLRPHCVVRPDQKSR